ncbi:methyl-accepting chemotaxis sensory transducer with Pas/Pac sensor [Duganella sp. CF402]|uniref:methyl-accepting chemotaxis protein n=1 Tax=unclassified Duganella TaxID=2636909 RepID=UPI0008C998FB|nr:MULTISPECIES: methyl-accepting chemotaxis protein [unclassified Duganella]RZT10231.1 methyl-accepting chemotaxis sensory transducer with Pas/Pac sensor [Duganella sp. BK701]SEL22547.1 methyl-accepting chemotaxis sensory transducer with Pas/Pac sensor [Duganella sp. CF402]
MHGHETVLEDGKPIVTTTDLKGRLTYVNSTFTAASGYTDQELTGKLQSTLYHSDMPPEVDADMWRTVQSGEPWRGLVKYSGKDGGYFWCIANVTPVMEGGKNTGFMSVCTKPKREQIEQAAQLYRTLKGNNPDGVRIVRGAEAARGWGKLRNALRDITLAQRLALSFGSMALLALAIASHALFDFADSTLIGMALLVAALALYSWRNLHVAIVEPIKSSISATRILAGGDLTTRMAVDRHDELGQLQAFVRQLNLNLASILVDIRSNFSLTRSTTTQVGAANSELSARTEAQAANLEQTSAHMGQITGMVGQTADNVNTASGVASEATALAERTGVAVTQVVAAMNDISQSSRKIVDIISLIDGIAFQTNILSLNAAVEAARAGESGRGFAVVASEVRNLAQRSAAAAKEIKALIDTSAGKIEIGAGMASAAGEDMQAVIAAIGRVASIMGDISGSTREQNNGVHQVQDAIMQLDEVTRQNAQMVEEAAVATGVLDMQTQAVAKALEVFKLPPQGGAKGKPGASLVLKKSQAIEPAGHSEERQAARRA